MASWNPSTWDQIRVGVYVAHRSADGRWASDRSSAGISEDRTYAVAILMPI